MNKNSVRPETVDDYIAARPATIAKRLEQLRVTIRKSAPEAVERISYQMPAFDQQGVLVWFAAWKEHIGFYPCPSAIRAFAADLRKFRQSRGAIQFPHDQPLPLALVRRMVQFRVRENRAKAAAKKPGGAKGRNAG
jgi:uncharacterized protein YdhG (YjbR/CyaY superfamily)